jgi:hypothetical protein
MRWIVGGKAASGCAASTSRMGRFETRWLKAEENLAGGMLRWRAEGHPVEGGGPLEYVAEYSI